MASIALQFPSKEVIISYLEHHPLTRDSYFSEKKIIEAAATFFADQEKVPAGINMGVLLTLKDLGITRDLTAVAATAIRMSLSQALTDCANGKPVREYKELENVKIKAKL